MVKKLAVVLFNLGGPDGPDAVRPFLFNLFRDPAIIGLPAVARYPLAALISTTREKTAQANYALLGGRSPLLPETEAQARALEAELSRRAPAIEAKVFISMRYWKPFAKQTAKAVAAFRPDEIVLLPLYPQFSTTTTASSLKDWARVYRGPGRTRTVCCYPTALGVVEAYAKTIRETWEKSGKPRKVRLLFSAHGLPQKVVDAGDPYRAQVEATAAAVAQRLPGIDDWQVCFQSRVGPLKWLEPATEDAIRQAAADGKGVLVSPIAFVSEHVETLVELDHEYAALARSLDMPFYLRAPAPGVTESFISALADAVLSAPERSPVAPFGPWLCPAGHGKCACREERQA
ncbi:ferrochelatase [Phenylobacterium sp.]|uniref:ferrochelatase n=1 Tax=Phenylobacterium sp. TaxID=1871053 RepID=UPI003918877D